MDLNEYNKVKDFSYEEYCDYLKEKYGCATCDYFYPNFKKNPKISRTSEGLVCHHICEDKAIMLSTVAYAERNPFEYQRAENLVYCDYLEHLFLHILICENPSRDRNPFEAVGIGGILNYLVPELNDVYSGWITAQTWRLKCHSLILNDRDVYLLLLKRFKTTCHNYPLYNEASLYSSFNEKFGLWDSNNNSEIYVKIKKL